jgi:hypothetical protein
VLTQHLVLVTKSSPKLTPVTHTLIIHVHIPIFNCLSNFQSHTIQVLSRDIASLPAIKPTFPTQAFKRHIHVVVPRESHSHTVKRVAKRMRCFGLFHVERVAIAFTSWLSFSRTRYSVNQEIICSRGTPMRRLDDHVEVLLHDCVAGFVLFSTVTVNLLRVFVQVLSRESLHADLRAWDTPR